MSEHPLVITNATKRFGFFTAVDDLSMTVPQGAIIGFLGPNGAGKSTSLRMALGVMNADKGSVALFGAPPNQTNLRRVGFLPEERGLYKKMTPRTTIAYFARLKGLSSKVAYARADELLETAGLKKFAKTKNSKLSKGMAQKVQILSTLAHKPDFLILDEPFSGLDPVNQQGLEDMIIAEHKRGATILFSTHVMEHAERLCDSIIMMAGGKKVFDGSLQGAFDVMGRGARIGVRGNFNVAEALSTQGFQAIEDTVEADTHWWRVELDKGYNAQDVLRAAIEEQVPVTGFMPDEARLRDVFVKLAGPQDPKAFEADPIEEVTT
ncbi:MAG: ATP-binding cassette domain-containing protein [Hyphomonadaceae bacterium]